MEVDTKDNLAIGLTGKIKAISCKNFVTYNECVMYPTEYLNVIIGPNGTGKSTLVAAIVLGMGGNAKLLSRSSAIEDYIKNGETEAMVSLEIYVNNDRTTNIYERRFNTEGKSEYLVNGISMNLKNYLGSISEFNIQVDNLCQFLPQDRVQDFAKMNAQELMNNTISSVCQPDVIDTFAKLKELQKQRQNTKHGLDNDIRRLNELKHRNEGLKQTLERIGTKQKFAEKINVCNAKKLWIEVKELKAKAEVIRGNLDDAEKILHTRKTTYTELINDQGAIVKKSEDLGAALQTQGRKCAEAEQKIESIVASIDDLEAKIRREKQNFETIKNEQAEREKDIYNESKNLSDVTDELKRAAVSNGSDSERAARLQVIRENLSRLKVEISVQMAKRSDINKRLDEDYVAELQLLKQRIQSLENFKDLRLKMMESKFPDQYKAVIWLRENLDKFEGRIYEPMILELNVKDPSHAKYFENSIALRDLLAFTCENKADMSKLINHLRIEQQLSISIVYSQSAEACQYVPSEPASSFEDFGFFAYLVQLVEGPPAVLNYLCRNYQLERILVGTDKVNECLDVIPSKIRNFFGGNTRYNVSISKYSREPIRSQNRIADRNILSGVDRNELNALKKRYSEKVRAADILRNERALIEARTNELEHQRADVMKEQRVFEMSVSKLRELKERLAKQARRVKELNAACVDIPRKQELFKERTKLYLKDIIKYQQEKVKCIGDYQRVLQEKECATSRVNIFKLENEDLSRAITTATESLMEAKKLVETIKGSMDTAAKKYRIKLVEAKGLSNGLKPSDENFPFTQQFAELPDDMEALKEIINDTCARLECLGETDQNVTEEYERRNAQIESLSAAIEKSQQGESTIKQQIDQMYSAWIPELNRVIEILNQSFGNFMKSMDYVGEIQLSMNEEWDFESYGIQIMVQYRNGIKLQALDRYVQSGGERAVAIAIYTLSLQQLTHVPFRCVDEINQGMDPRNERKIFDMLVDETTKIGSSQYFFVTPKLLPNLNYNENMTVHIVFNGKFVKSKDAFNFVF